METSTKNKQYIHTPPFSISEAQRKAVETFEHEHKWLDQDLFFFNAQGEMLTCQHPSFDEYLKRVNEENARAFEHFEKIGYFAEA